MITAAGTGTSRSGDIAISRWRNDGTTDAYGQWCYLKDVRTGRVWSSGHQPVCAAADSYHADLAHDMVTIRRQDGDLETVTEVAVNSTERCEVRRVTVTNRSSERATVELTSYQEIVIAPHASDRGHRAFSNLFVQTEWLPGSATLLAMRRPRSAMDTPAWCGHTIAVAGDLEGHVTYETDRAVFIGRGRTSRKPVAMDNPGELSGTAGAVLDPVLALRVRLAIDAGSPGQVSFTTFVARDREEALTIATRHHETDSAGRLFAVAASESAAMLDELGVSVADAERYQALAAELLYRTRSAGKMSKIRKGEGGRAELINTGPTGEWPILLATLGNREDIGGIADLLKLHHYWRVKEIGCDLVILCDDPTGEIEEAVISIVSSTEWKDRLDRPRGVFVRHRSSLSTGEIEILESTARLHARVGDGLIGATIDG